MSRRRSRCCATSPGCCGRTAGSFSARPRRPSGSTTTTNGWRPAGPLPIEGGGRRRPVSPRGGEAAMRAMVIDDSRAMRMILKRIIAKLNFEAIEAGDGQEALDLLATMTEVPELALIDWNMPNMNGLEFVTKARADPRLREMTLVMVTTESEQNQIVRALAAGAHEYVIKPFTEGAMIEKLALLGLVPTGANS